MFKEICLSGKSCELMKAIKNPKYGSKTVLTNSCWEYVELFLKRHSSAGASDALFYWKQAHSFYLASLSLPVSAKPLTSYYCILNCSKALLRFKSIDNNKLNSHGISTVRATSNKTNLNESETDVKGAGVLPELGKYFGSQLESGKYKILDLMYNVPCVHRAFCITTGKPEIFIPILYPVFVKKEGSKEAWLKCCLEKKYANLKILKYLPTKFQYDKGVDTEYVIRTKKRFSWDIHKKIDARKHILCKYHEKVRKYIYYIYGESKLWYLKKSVKENEHLSGIVSPILIFCIFHWLSELVRYNPRLFQKYMRSKQNWLIQEFINNSLDQFVDEISCEITGQDIMCTGYRK